LLDAQPQRRRDDASRHRRFGGRIGSCGGDRLGAFRFRRFGGGRRRFDDFRLVDGFRRGRNGRLRRRLLFDSRIGATALGGSGAFLPAGPFLAPFGAGVSEKMSPVGSAMLRWRARRSTNCRATTSSMVLDALFTSMP
jgi:hypothetical protein